MICKFCRSSQIYQKKIVKSQHYKEKEYILYECKNCLSQFFNINQHELSINHLYETIADGNVISEKYRRNPYWENQKRIIYKLLKKVPTSVLDVGCRTGDFLLHFDKKTIREGIEISQKYAEIAQSRGLKVYNKPLENIKFEKKYDIVSAYAILEHLVNPLDFLDKLQALIKNQGVLVILIPSFECIFVKLQAILKLKWHMYRPPEHINFFSKKYLDSYLNAHGFKLVKRFSTSGGIFNPFRNIPLIGRIFGLFMFYFDRLIINKVPIFDHLYSYYKKFS